MLIENIMYFALGVLIAGLVALIIMPAVWKRAVRLTKRRIEAATPITMAEFRADKDQLRAEFALSTRKQEMTIDTLRQRLAEQLGDANQKRTDLGAMKSEREQNLAIVGELEAREATLRARTSELEKQNTDLAQRLRMRERDVEARGAEIDALRRSLETAPAANSNRRDTAANDLSIAEARMASAETRLNALLEDTTQSDDQPAKTQHLADKLSLEDRFEHLRSATAAVEASILANWQTDDFPEDALRARLGDIASGISQLVYAADNEAAPAAPEESLFDRVQRFADDGETLDVLPAPEITQRGSVTDRLEALQQYQGR